MDRLARQQRIAFLALAAAAALALPCAPVRAGGEVEAVEREFKQAVDAYEREGDET